MSSIKNKKSVQLNTIKEDIEAIDINTAIEVESAINKYLRRSSETFDLRRNYEVSDNNFICNAFIGLSLYEYKEPRVIIIF